MRKQAPVVEWYVAENDADWVRRGMLPLPDITLAASRLLRLKRYCWSVAALFLLVVGAGAWWWRPTQSRAPTAAAAVTAMAQQEPSVVTPRLNQPTLVEQFADQQALAEFQATMAWTGQSARYESDLDAGRQTLDPGDQFDLALYTVDMQGDQAVTRVVTMAKSGPYRQTLFYRRTAEGWQQIPPDAALWGPERNLETPFFVYHFRQYDAPAVIAVAPQIDALYATLWRNVGLPLTSLTDQQVHVPLIPDAEKLVIEVSVTQPPGQTASRLYARDRFIVPSPAVYIAPIELTDAELLAQSIALPLIEHVLAQAREHHAIEASWQPLVKGLHLWQVWDLDLPLSAWREEVVQWLYLDLPATRPGQQLVMPKHYPQFCALHRLWLPSRAQLGIPIVCTERDGENWFFSLARNPRYPLTHLDQFAVPLRLDEYDSLEKLDHPGHTVALATLIDYAVATYGRERLPTLVAGLGQYDTWETLLPAVYGVSRDEFEAGWQAYLSAHYGVSLDILTQ